MNLQQPPTFGPLFQWALNQFKLGPLWEYIQIFHPSGPKYHSLDHLSYVAAAATWIALRQGYDPKLACLAGMLHDYGHTGTSDDALNVRTALELAGGLFQINKVSSTPLIPVTTEEFGILSTAIQATEFRATTKTWVMGPQNVLGQILRDADVWHPMGSVIASVTFLQSLKTEMSEYSKEVASMSLGDFVNANAEFFHTIEYFTSTGKLYQPTLEHQFKIIERVCRDI